MDRSTEYLDVHVIGIESYASRPAVDAQYLEALLIARRVLGTPGAQLSAIEAIDAAASSLEHQHPTQDEGLARLLRLSVNVLLYLGRHHSDLISEVNDRLTLRFGCPLCGAVNEPVKGEIVMERPYRCDECMTALVFSVRSPELDAMHDEVSSKDGPQW